MTLLLRRRLALSSLLGLLLLTVPDHADAQLPSRATTGRARMELGFDHGVGFGSEGGYLELGLDGRVFAPFGLGVVVRAGLALAPVSLGYVAEAGLAYRLDLVSSTRAGVQLVGVVGPSVAYGPFDRGDAAAVGGFAMLHLDVWVRNVFFGIGASGHALATLSNDAANDLAPPRAGPLLTVAPTLRVGGEWGL